MGALARQWECDPANATWIIDRLERLGYATRLPSPTDRRAKLVVLTSQGARVKRAITKEFYAPPPELLTLDGGQLEELNRVFQRLLAGFQPPYWTNASSPAASSSKGESSSKEI